MTDNAPRLKTLAVIGGLLLALVVFGLLFWVNPEQHGIFPVCPLHRFTGLNCPGCGGLRAMHHLLHGRWLTAFHCNPLLVTALPVMLAVVVSALIQKRSLLPEFQKLARPTLLVIGLAVVIAFGVLRNLPYPAFAWMSP